MAITTTGSFPQKPKNWKVQILPADASGLKTLATGSADGTKINAIIAASNDTANRDIQLGITRAGVFFPLYQVTITTLAAFAAGTTAVNVLNPTLIPGLPIDSDGNPYILLSDASDTLQVKCTTTVTAAKEIDITAFGADWS